MRQMFVNFKSWLRHLGWDSLPASELNRMFIHYQRVYHRGAISQRWPGQEEWAQEMRHEQECFLDYAHTEYYLRLDEPCVIEPLHGTVIVRKNRIARYLMAIHPGVRMDPMYYLHYLRNLAHASAVEEAILMRHPYGEDNYGHFFLDIIPKLLMAETLSELRGLPFIIGRALAEKPYFQSLLKRSDLSRRKWIVQEGIPIRVNRLHCLKGLAYTSHWVEGIWRLFGVKPDPAPSRRRIYLKRNSPRRRLRNRSEVEQLLNRNGFETIDTAAMPHDAQIRLFGEIRYMVAEHGSGLANLLLRRGNPLSVLELFPGDYLSPCFAGYAHLTGVAYERLRGTNLDNKESYSVPLHLLTQRLHLWLAGEKTGPDFLPS